MKNNDDLQAGEKIELLLKRDNDKYTEVYFSKIEDVIDSKTYAISRPVSGGRYTYLSLGQEIGVAYFREDAEYVFDARVIERIKYGETVSAVISVISERRKLQRRNYYRLGIMIPVMLEYKHMGITVVNKLDTADISGGGIRLISPENINIGQEVTMSIAIPGVEGNLIKGRVVRSIHSERNKKRYDIGVEFLDIHPRIRQLIIQYIFAKQRELLKKGVK